jgi:hypothetical protein
MRKFLSVREACSAKAKLGFAKARGRMRVFFPMVLACYTENRHGNFTGQLLCLSLPLRVVRIWIRRAPRSTGAPLKVAPSLIRRRGALDIGWER